MIKLTGERKTHAEWEGDLGEYLKPGDEIDMALYGSCRGALPPITHTADCLQMSEPYDHDGPGGLARYLSFQRFGMIWVYVGPQCAGNFVRVTP